LDAAFVAGQLVEDLTLVAIDLIGPGEQVAAAILIELRRALHSFISSNLCCIWLHGFRANTPRDCQDRPENTRDMQSVAVVSGLAGDVARCCIGCVRLRGGPLGPFCIFSDFKERGMGSFLHPAVTVAR
jgi:hypothetical protein